MFELAAASLDVLLQLDWDYTCSSMHLLLNVQTLSISGQGSLLLTPKDFPTALP